MRDVVVKAPSSVNAKQRHTLGEAGCLFRRDGLQGTLEMWPKMSIGDSWENV